MPPPGPTAVSKESGDPLVQKSVMYCQLQLVNFQNSMCCYWGIFLPGGKSTSVNMPRNYHVHFNLSPKTAMIRLDIAKLSLNKAMG